MVAVGVVGLGHAANAGVLVQVVSDIHRRHAVDDGAGAVAKGVVVVREVLVRDRGICRRKHGVNLGTIDADVAGMCIVINPRGTGTFTNQGTIRARSGATLVVSGDLTQIAGSIVLAGGTIDPTGNSNRCGAMRARCSGTTVIRELG